MLLSFTADFAFGDITTPQDCSTSDSHACSIQAPYTKNFLSYDFRAIGYFLNLFPVFVCWTSYPIIAITLKKNLIQLFAGTISPAADVARSRADKELLQAGTGSAHPATVAPKVPLWKRLLFPTIAGVLPLTIAVATRDFELLVDITGSYPGIGVEFVIPTLLVVFGRRWVQQQQSTAKGGKVINLHRSPFHHKWWPWAIFGWVIVSFGLNTYNVINKIMGN